ncbi:hypothetical protein [Nocardia sp. NPDC058633]|uniref:hypothetical protein n=1 Tax=Nocardia sp. NPDC058633 TaxID=3346568 RepID=UPI0036616FD5
MRTLGFVNAVSPFSSFAISCSSGSEHPFIITLPFRNGRVMAGCGSQPLTAVVDAPAERKYMSSHTDRSAGRFVLQHFDSPGAYSRAYPTAKMPDPVQLVLQRRFDAGGTGVRDDLVDSGSMVRIDFLPGGAPGADDTDRTGVVVATLPAHGAVYVLAKDVSLRAAWQTIRAQWPTTLSEVCSALADARWYSGRP